MTRAKRILTGAVNQCSFYRANPDLFARDYLHLNLHLFQRILLVMMNLSTTFVLIACRGLGKSFIAGVFCCIRCILYPGTKICIVSGNRGQSINILEKILLELCPRSPELRCEINDKDTKLSQALAIISFKNTSFIKVVTANDGARGNRANILIGDEYRMIPKDIYDTVARKFLTNPREPGYLSKPEYRHLVERNKTILLSSAYFKDHWSYTKVIDTCKFMLDDKRKDFVCGLPYQLAIQERLISADDVADQMAESDFNEIKWGMEMEALWFGDTEDSFYDFNSISKNRKIKYAMLPNSLYSALNNANFKIPPKQPGEKRILSADIALMSSNKKHDNDATAIFINQMLPTKSGRFINNIVYTDTYEGLHTEAQALVIRKMFEEYDCDIIVLDCNGLGLGVYDALVRDISDPDTGEIYPAISCMNSPEMAERCVSKNAKRVIWSIKGNANLNSECAILLREGFRSGKIRLLVTEYDAEEIFSGIKSYDALTPVQKTRLQLPYVYTTLLVDELVKLKHDESGGRVRGYERSGMRKDRYSSLSYNYYVSAQLENKINRRYDTTVTSTPFMYRPPKIK